MRESKPTQETEEIRSKLDYEGQLIWRFGQFFNACENGDGLKAERSLANIFSFLTRDLREKVKQRSEYENPREIRKDNYGYPEDMLKKQIRKAKENGDEDKIEYWKQHELNTISGHSPQACRDLAEDWKNGRKEMNSTQRIAGREHYTSYSDRVIPKLQKFGRHILDVLNEEGRLFETRRIGKGTEE